MTELFSLLHFIAPTTFPSEHKFLKKYGGAQEFNNTQKIQALHQAIRPYLLRRMKNDVEDIPVKSETIIEVELTRVQKQYYRALHEKNFRFLAQGISNNKNIPSLMNVMTELRKCCNHPFLIQGAEDAIIKKAGCKNEMDYFQTLIKASGKFVLLDKLLPRLREGGHKVLIFSQWTRILDTIQTYLQYKRYIFERIDGNVKRIDRQAAIDRFSLSSKNETNQQSMMNKDPDTILSPTPSPSPSPSQSTLKEDYSVFSQLTSTVDRFVFLLCTKAGGLGINLTAADTVIIFDSDWNPQNDIQAIARCHRIGQTKEVRVYRLLTKNTYESFMYQQASLKLGLDKAVMSGVRAHAVMDNEKETGQEYDQQKKKIKKEKQKDKLKDKDNVKVGNLSRKEIDESLKRGALEIFKKKKTKKDNIFEEDNKVKVKVEINEKEMEKDYEDNEDKQNEDKIQDKQMEGDQNEEEDEETDNEFEAQTIDDILNKARIVKYDQDDEDDEEDDAKEIFEEESEVNLTENQKIEKAAERERMKEERRKQKLKEKRLKNQSTFSKATFMMMDGTEILDMSLPQQTQIDQKLMNVENENIQQERNIQQEGQQMLEKTHDDTNQNELQKINIIQSQIEIVTPLATTAFNPESDLQIDDPEFWKKLLPEVNAKAEAEDAEQTIIGLNARALAHEGISMSQAVQEIVGLTDEQYQVRERSARVRVRQQQQQRKQKMQNILKQRKQEDKQSSDETTQINVNENGQQKKLEAGEDGWVDDAVVGDEIDDLLAQLEKDDMKWAQEMDGLNENSNEDKNGSNKEIKTQDNNLDADQLQMLQNAKRRHRRDDEEEEEKEESEVILRDSDYSSGSSNYDNELGRKKRGTWEPGKPGRPPLGRGIGTRRRGALGTIGQGSTAMTVQMNQSRGRQDKISFEVELDYADDYINADDQNLINQKEIENVQQQQPNPQQKQQNIQLNQSTSISHQPVVDLKEDGHLSLITERKRPGRQPQAGSKPKGQKSGYVYDEKEFELEEEQKDRINQEDNIQPLNIPDFNQTPHNLTSQSPAPQSNTPKSIITPLYTVPSRAPLFSSQSVSQIVTQLHWQRFDEFRLSDALLEYGERYDIILRRTKPFRESGKTLHCVKQLSETLLWIMLETDQRQQQIIKRNDEVYNIQMKIQQIKQEIKRRKKILKKEKEKEMIKDIEKQEDDQHLNIDKEVIQNQIEESQEIETNSDLISQLKEAEVELEQQQNLPQRLPSIRELCSIAPPALDPHLVFFFLQTGAIISSNTQQQSSNNNTNITSRITSPIPTPVAQHVQLLVETASTSSSSSGYLFFIRKAPDFGKQFLKMQTITRLVTWDTLGIAEKQRENERWKNQESEKDFMKDIDILKDEQSNNLFNTFQITSAYPPSPPLNSSISFPIYSNIEDEKRKSLQTYSTPFIIHPFPHSLVNSFNPLTVIDYFLPFVEDGGGQIKHSAHIPNWWNNIHDRGLIVGTWKHGSGNWKAIRSDPQLPFVEKVGIDESWNEEDETEIDLEIEKNNELNEKLLENQEIKDGEDIDDNKGIMSESNSEGSENESTTTSSGSSTPTKKRGRPSTALKPKKKKKINKKGPKRRPDGKFISTRGGPGRGHKGRMSSLDGQDQNGEINFEQNKSKRNRKKKPRTKPGRRKGQIDPGDQGGWPSAMTLQLRVRLIINTYLELEEQYRAVVERDRALYDTELNDKATPRKRTTKRKTKQSSVTKEDLNDEIQEENESTTNSDIEWDSESEEKEQIMGLLKDIQNDNGNENEKATNKLQEKIKDEEDDQINSIKSMNQNNKIQIWLEKKEKRELLRQKKQLRQLKIIRLVKNLLIDTGQTHLLIRFNNLRQLHDQQNQVLIKVAGTIAQQLLKIKNEQHLNNVQSSNVFQQPALSLPQQDDDALLHSLTCCLVREAEIRRFWVNFREEGNFKTKTGEQLRALYDVCVFEGRRQSREERKKNQENKEKGLLEKEQKIEEKTQIDGQEFQIVDPQKNQIKKKDKNQQKNQIIKEQTVETGNIGADQLQNKLNDQTNTQDKLISEDISNKDQSQIKIRPKQTDKKDLSVCGLNMSFLLAQRARRVVQACDSTINI
ncbi:MAG: putative Chromodomain-helicase-DNA-binding protein 8 [Streblomastix strix]|uniref:Putative Chromodomain-helicase-DNA-binding protein 8 n=1 Tax=Streblomastix strix TaxID=222440 RepID=A0A5J4WN70_9EUKA|nr:MAG: putative Chromodomain-helicase-DNA-binding protein 8 [Streblomastix strix]